jgi:glyoxylase-like metal-dependent hydrolase (beta-lactamase superfamily II)
MKIIPLSEGAFSIDKTKVFIPFDKAKDDLQKRAPGSLLVEIQPFVVITNKDIIVLDTGLGFTNPDGILQIHQHLTDNGICPMDVTKVLLSHLHKDHAGGISIADKIHGGVFFSFPNASYYVNEKELAYGLANENQSYLPEEFKILSNSDKVVLLNDEGEIDGYIKYKMTGAHSPYHTVFWIEEENQTIFFGGDVAPQLQQMKSRFVAKYDFDGKKSMELRTQWWQQGQQEHWTFLFYHDIKSPMLVL